MNFDTTSYIFYILTLFFIVIFFLTRHQVINELKLKFLQNRGRCFVRIIGADKRENEAFVNFRADYIQVGDRIFVKSHEKQTMKSGNTMFESPLKLMPYKGNKEGMKLKLGTGFLGLVKKPFVEAVPPENVPINEEGYILDERRSTFRGKFPVFTYRYDNPEPIDFFEESRPVVAEGHVICPNEQCKNQVPVSLPVQKAEGTVTCPKCAKPMSVSILVENIKMPKPVDNAYYSSIIKKALALGRLKDSSGLNKRMMLFLTIAAIAAVAAAWFAYQNNAQLADIVRRGIQVKG